MSPTTTPSPSLPYASSVTFLPHAQATTSKPSFSPTLSTLESLINVFHQSLRALPSNLSSFNDPVLVPCPYNPAHRLPPESLFRHTLQCPTHLDLGLLLDSLRYPHTLKSSVPSQTRNRFAQDLPTPDSDLCLCFDGFYYSSCNYFYRDCPGVVSSQSLKDADAYRTFTLPGCLLVECVNFIGTGGREIQGIESDRYVLSVSELWKVMSEIEVWADYPDKYSYCLLKAILGIWKLRVSKIMKWLIVSSPNYGVVIDLAMRDHVFLLLRLCLKAITKEALNFVEIILTKEMKEQSSEVDTTGQSFRCPALVEVLRWLSSQLSVLYGEVNGRFFAIAMLKQCVLYGASGSLLFPLQSDVIEYGVPEGDVGDGKGCNLEGENCITSDIFVSQVAAAVAALHERSVLEELIKTLRTSLPPTRYQMMSEYAYVTKRAEEERKKNKNYRPIIEFDGLLWQRSQSQETSKTKTREELLAEERDYKRRRMSYRGRKTKRTTIQVMRDIIEDYMEDIRQAGGIGCFVNKASERGALPSEPISAHSNSVVDPEMGKEATNFPEESKQKPHDKRKQISSSDNLRPLTFDCYRSSNYDAAAGSYHGRGCLKDGGSRSDRNDRGSYSRSPDRFRNHEGFHVRDGSMMNRDHSRVRHQSYE